VLCTQNYAPTNNPANPSLQPHTLADHTHPPTLQKKPRCHVCTNAGRTDTSHMR